VPRRAVAGGTPSRWCSPRSPCREVLIGLALGFVLQARALAVRVGGELIGQRNGFNMASSRRPAARASSTPLITQFYEGLFLLGLLAVDGHHLLVRALADSFERAPVGELGELRCRLGAISRRMTIGDDQRWRGHVRRAGDGSAFPRRRVVIG
jgi:hypothetical protein